MNIKLSYNWIKEYLETDATPQQVQKYLSLSGPSVEKITKVGNDYIFDVEITSNRIDTVSVIGFAREAAAILPRYDIKAKFKDLKVGEPTIPEKKLPLKIDDPKKLTRRLLGVVMFDVELGSSPLYIEERLQACDVRSLNNVIDITNYVMLETGHPTHVFDYDRVKTTELILRKAKSGEKLVTLDGKEMQLTENDVVIDDGTGRIVDLPGIMGTENSVVTNATRRIIFFIESNNPYVIRQTSMRLGLRSMAATINEKRPDPNLAKTAFLRGIELFEKISKAKVGSEIVDIYPKPLRPTQLKISLDFLNAKTGIKLSPQEIVNILESLGFGVKKTANIFTIEVPTFRVEDVSIPEDIVEEVARVYGYHNLPNVLPPPVYLQSPKEAEELFAIQTKIKYFLKNLGLREVLNYSMISKEMLDANDLGKVQQLRLKNSISEEISYMRRFLLPSLIKNIKDNEGKKDTLRFFEISKTYKPTESELPVEEYKLGIVTNTSFSDLKGIVDALLSELHISESQIQKDNHPLLIVDKQGKVTVGRDRLGEFGQLKTEYRLKNGVKSEVFLAIFDLAMLIKYAKALARYKPINVFASVLLDLTVEETESLNYQKILEIAKKSSKALSEIEFLDKFNNKVTLRLHFSLSNRNITEEEAKEELKDIQNNLSKY